MRIADQKQLELLYEQITKDFTTLLDKEKQFAEVISKDIAPKLVRAIAAKIEHNTNVDGEYLSEFMYPYFFRDAITIFGPDIKIVEDTYFDIIRIDVHQNLVYVKLLDDEPYVVFRSAEYIVDRYNEDTEHIPYTNEKRIEEELRTLIENAILVRYKEMLSPKTITTVHLRSDSKWVNWRKSEIKYHEMKDKLPELKGIF